jgi:predicted dehydrogenase
MSCTLYPIVRSARQVRYLRYHGDLPEPLRIAFLGCGFITGIHSRALQSLRGVVACGYASRDRARAEACSQRAMYRDLVGAIGEGRPPEMSLERAIDDQQLMDQIYATSGSSSASDRPDPVAGRIGQ